MAVIVYLSGLPNAFTIWAKWFIVLATMLLTACGSIHKNRWIDPAIISSTEAESRYLSRANSQAIMRSQVTVRVAALQESESHAIFGFPLAEIGIQPVWINIRNDGKSPYWFMPAFLDRDFYSAREVAYLSSPSSNNGSHIDIQKKLIENEVSLHIKPGQVVSGFVYTNLTRGIKLLNVELLGARDVLRFSFAREQSDGRFDYQVGRSDGLGIAKSVVGVGINALGQELQRLPCCTTNVSGKELGDPLNFVMIGSENDILVALVRAGWDFTDTINATTISRVITSYTFGSNYRNSPISPLYFEGRSQDFSMQRARAGISQRNHLRLWMTQVRVEGVPLWVGQISRDIGIKFTTHSSTMTTHVIDPDVDGARDYLLQSMLIANNVAGWGYSKRDGQIEGKLERFNLTQDPYFTDGRVAVIFIAKEPLAIQDAKFYKW